VPSHTVVLLTAGHCGCQRFTGVQEGTRTTGLWRVIQCKDIIAVSGGLKIVMEERFALLCSTKAPAGIHCWRWDLGWALGHPSAKPAKHGPGIPFADGDRARRVWAVEGGLHSPLACPSRSRIAPAGRLGASWTRCELLASPARSSAQSGGRKVGLGKPLHHPSVGAPRPSPHHPALGMGEPAQHPRPREKAAQLLVRIHPSVSRWGSPFPWQEPAIPLMPWSWSCPPARGQIPAL